MKIAKKMGVPVRIVHAHSIPNDKGPKQWARLYMRNRLKGCTLMALPVQKKLLSGYLATI